MPYVVAFLLFAIATQASAQVVPIRSGTRADRTFGSGTGIAVYSDATRSLYITCEHVANTKTVYVGAAPGRVIAKDAERDIALIEIAVPSKHVATLGDDLKPGDLIDIAAYPDGLRGGIEETFGVAVTSEKANYQSAPGWSGAPVGKQQVLRAMHLGRIGANKKHAYLLPVSQIKEFLAQHVTTKEGCIGFT